jgi:hypothetical protein
MAKAKTAKAYIVTVENRPDFCGEGAGGAQFAQGKATITSARLAQWFSEHEGYKVEAVEEPEPEPAK